MLDTKDTQVPTLTKKRGRPLETRCPKPNIMQMRKMTLNFQETIKKIEIKTNTRFENFPLNFKNGHCNDDIKSQHINSIMEQVQCCK